MTISVRASRMVGSRCVQCQTKCTMSEENNNTPQQPIGVEMPGEADAMKERLRELQPYLLDATENYPEPIYLLEYNGVPFSTLGGIQALSGQKKNGKTFLCCGLM